MATQVGSLYTSLTLESASFLSNMKRAATAAEQGAAQIDRAFGIVKGAATGFIAALSVDVIGTLVTKGLDYASSLGEVSQQLGVTARDLQVYRFAATQVGVSQDQIENGLQRLTRTIGTGSKAFAELGINTKDAGGNTRATGDVFRDIADKLSKIEDPARRAALEIQLFGRSGQNLDTLLTEGARGIDGYAASARELGLVLDDAAIKKADDAADKIGALNQVLGANIAGVVADNANAILGLGDAIASTARAALGGFQTIGEYYAGLKSLARSSPVDLVKGLLFSDEDIVQAGRSANYIQNFTNQLGSFKLSNGPQTPARSVGGPDVPAPPRAASGRSPRAARAAADPRAGLDELLAQVPKLSDAFTSIGDSGAQTLARLDGSATTLAQTLDKAFSTDNLQGLIQQVPDLSAGLDRLNAAGEKFSTDLSRGLGQAIIYGQSLGDALINSIKAAAAELITSGLLDLLKGGGGGGGLFGSIVSGIGAIFGGGKAAGGSVRRGISYDVGELGRERFVAPADGQIIPANMLNGSNDNGRQRVAVSVDVQPSPLFVTTVATVSQQAGQRAAAEQSRVNNRPRLAGGRG